MKTAMLFSARLLRCTGLSLFSAAIASFLAPSAQAVPSFARQTGMSCIVCHTEYPILTDFGRQFKLGGYTMDGGQSELPPLALMLQPSYTATNKGQPGGAAEHFADNSNVALTQASIFYSGRLFGPYADRLFGTSVGNFLNKFGVFIQATYDGVEQNFGWDNAELRFADSATLFGQPLTYGFYLNNNPGMQDPWNTTPVWGFPFSSSGLGPTPGAASLIDGGLSQQVAGLGGYIMLANSVYLDIGGYRSLSTSFQTTMGVDPDGETQIAGIAPYWRLAYTKAMGNQSFEAGLFGLAAHTYPGRDRTAGKDRTLDWGLDAQYQISVGKNDFTGLFSWIYETDHWDASLPLGNAANATDHLATTKATIDYLYDKTYGGAVSYFLTTGSHDAALHSESTTGSPLSDGVVLQLNWLPLNKGGGPSFWPKSNVKLSAQYIIYNRFDGARTNYDGTGRNAKDNNTLYLEAWIAF